MILMQYNDMALWIEPVQYVHFRGASSESFKRKKPGMFDTFYSAFNWKSSDIRTQ